MGQEWVLKRLPRCPEWEKWPCLYYSNDWPGTRVHLKCWLKWPNACCRLEIHKMAMIRNCMTARQLVLLKEDGNISHVRYWILFNHNWRERHIIEMACTNLPTISCTNLKEKKKVLQLFWGPVSLSLSMQSQSISTAWILYILGHSIIRDVLDVHSNQIFPFILPECSAL